MKVDGGECGSHLLLKVKQCRFGDLKPDNALGTESRELPAKLRTYRPSRPGNQNDLALYA